MALLLKQNPPGRSVGLEGIGCIYLGESVLRNSLLAYGALGDGGDRVWVVRSAMWLSR